MKNDYSTLQFENSQNHLGFEIRTLDYIYNNEHIEEFERPHQIKFYCIIYIVQGSGEHNINFKSYKFQKGSILFVSKNQIQAFKKSLSAKGYVILFDEEFLNQNQIKFNDLSYSYPFNFGLFDRVLQVDRHQEIFTSLFDYIYLEYSLPLKSNSEEILQCLLRTVLLKIKSYHQDIDQKDLDIIDSSKRIFIQFQLLLDQNIDIRNVNFFCENLKIPYRSLNEISKKLTGETIKKYIDKNLILTAKQYLSVGNRNISEIAYQLGFDETTNFSKFFKKQTNYAPSEFLKSLKLN